MSSRRFVTFIALCTIMLLVAAGFPADNVTADDAAAGNAKVKVDRRCFTFPEELTGGGHLDIEKPKETDQPIAKSRVIREPQCFEIEHGDRVTFIAQGELTDAQAVILAKSEIPVHELYLWRAANLTKDGFSQLVRIKTVDTLRVLFADRVTYEWYEAISDANNIRCLEVVCGGMLGERDAVAISRMPNLEQLDLVPGSFATSDMLPPLAGTQKLRSLKLRHPRFSDKDIGEVIAKLPNLVQLDLTLKGSNGSVLAWVPVNTKIAKLSVCLNWRYGGEDIQELTRFNHLRVLELSSYRSGGTRETVHLDAQALKTLSSLNQLEELSLNGVGGLDNEFFAKLAAFPELREVGFRDCMSISHEALAALCKAKNLKVIRISGSADAAGIDAAKIDALRETYPQVRFYVS